VKTLLGGHGGGEHVQADGAGQLALQRLGAHRDLCINHYKISRVPDPDPQIENQEFQIRIRIRSGSSCELEMEKKKLAILVNLKTQMGRSLQLYQFFKYRYCE